MEIEVEGKVGIHRNWHRKQMQEFHYGSKVLEGEYTAGLPRISFVEVRDVMLPLLPLLPSLASAGVSTGGTGTSSGGGGSIFFPVRHDAEH